MRTSARLALIQTQDDRALRVSLLARPRTTVEFVPGDMGAYWRNQKMGSGSLQTGGKWWGTAIVLGKVGRNYVLMHRRQLQVIRCAPEQVRAATTEEKVTLGTPQDELRGIKDMIDQGNIRSQQFLELVAQSYPPEAEEVKSPEAEPRIQEPAAVRAPPESTEDTAHPPPLQLGSKMSDENDATEKEAHQELQDNPEDLAKHKRESLPIPERSQYGPVRRRVTGKDGPRSLCGVQVPCNMMNS